MKARQEFETRSEWLTRMGRLAAATSGTYGVFTLKKGGRV